MADSDKDGNQNPDGSKTPSENRPTGADETTKDVLEYLQSVDNVIDNIAHSIQIQANDTQLANGGGVFETELAKLDDKFEKFQRLTSKMDENTLRRSDDHLDSLGEYHKVIVLLNRNQTTTTTTTTTKTTKSPVQNVMILESRPNCEDVSSSCRSTRGGDDETCSCSEHSTGSDGNNANKLSSERSGKASLESNNAELRNHTSEIRACLQDVVQKNQHLRFELNNLVVQNRTMEKSLKCPAPFKLAEDGGIRFPGKKDMEQNILAMKTAILKLHAEIKEAKFTRMKSDQVKILLKQYYSKFADCKCEDSLVTKNNDVNDVCVKKEQICDITRQIKQKKAELVKMKSNYEAALKKNKKIFVKKNVLDTKLIVLKRKLQDYPTEDESEDMENYLNEIKEETEMMELMFKEFSNENKVYDAKMIEEKAEIAGLNKKTKTLEVALKNLTSEFDAAFKNLEAVYQEQVEEMLALPKIMKITHLKLQKQMDLRMLADETRNKLEKEIKEAESLEKPVQNKTELTPEKVGSLIKDLENQNKTLESTLKSLRENIDSATESLNETTRELDAVTLEVQNTVKENDRHLGAFDKFTVVYLGCALKSTNSLQDLLKELYSKECVLGVVKKKVMDHIKGEIDSITRNVEECKLQFQNTLNRRSNCTTTTTTTTTTT